MGAGVGAGFGSAFSRLLSDATSTKSSSSCSVMTRYDMDMAWFVEVRGGEEKVRLMRLLTRQIKQVNQVFMKWSLIRRIGQ